MGAGRACGAPNETNFESHPHPIFDIALLLLRVIVYKTKKNKPMHSTARTPKRGSGGGGGGECNLCLCYNYSRNGCFGKYVHVGVAVRQPPLAGGCGGVPHEVVVVAPAPHRVGHHQPEGGGPRPRAQVDEDGPANRKERNVCRVGIFLDFGSPSTRTEGPRGPGVRADGRTKSNWPPIGVELNGLWRRTG